MRLPPVSQHTSIANVLWCTGFLPFSAIYIELYYIFASVWGHKVRPLTVCLGVGERGVTRTQPARLIEGMSPAYGRWNLGT